jgi:hypothetical protein
MSGYKIRKGGIDQFGESAAILATAYLRLLARHGPKWRKHLTLADNQKDEKSAKICAARLDFRANKSIRCAGRRTVTYTLTRS